MKGYGSDIKFISRYRFRFMCACSRICYTKSKIHIQRKTCACNNFTLHLAKWNNISPTKISLIFCRGFPFPNATFTCYKQSWYITCMIFACSNVFAAAGPKGKLKTTQSKDLSRNRCPQVCPVGRVGGARTLYCS